MILLEHPIFPFVLPYLHVGEGERANVDVLQPPDQLRDLCLDVEVNCASCGRAIHCFKRRAKSERSRIAGAAEERRLYYTGTCSSEENAGCARTNQSKELKAAVVRKINAFREALPQRHQGGEAI